MRPSHPPGAHQEGEDLVPHPMSQLEKLLETARYLTSSLDRDEVLVRIGNTAKELLDTYGSAIYLLEPDGQTLKPAVAFEPYDQEILAACIPVDGSFTGQAVRQRKGLIFNNATARPGGYQIPDTPVEEEEHVIVTPLIVDDVVLGGMCLNRLGRPFIEAELALAQTFAGYAEIALKNAQTHQVLQLEVVERQRAEEALRQSMAELHTRNEELDAFAHTVAHDLQNPLAIIIGTAELLEMDLDDLSAEQLGHHLHTIAQNGQKMDRIIDELLLLAQVRRGEVALEMLDMAAIVAETLCYLDDMIETYRAGISAPEHWPTALGYAPWVEQVWLNYLSNAIKYGGKPPRIELGYTILDSGSGASGQAPSKVQFWVRDNGAGLSPEEQKRLFTPFTRLDQLRARGYGLGLSIVQRIVDKLGGEVAIDSSGIPGQGSTFCFTLPAAPQSEP